MPTAAAQSVVYHIDSEESFIRIVPGVPNSETFVVQEGTRIVTTVAVIEQVPGSLHTALTGTLQATLAGDTITFSGGSVIDAVENPGQPFLPSSAFGADGTGSLADEDNYGGFGALGTADTIVGKMALRDVVGDIVAGSASLGGSVQDLQFAVTQGTFDFLLDILDAYGFYDLPTQLSPENNQSMGTLAGSLDARISIPLRLDFAFDILQASDSRLIVEGQIVASRETVLAGDYNGNGLVEQGDLDLVLLNWGADAAMAPAQWRHQLPVGRIDQAELDGVLLNWGSSEALPTRHATVPEPQSLAVLVLSAALLFAARRLR